MKRGEIYFMNKQGHDNIQQGYRPVIIIQNDKGNQHSPTTIICSITTAKKKPLPTHLYIGASGGLHKESTILCEQIETISKTDLDIYVGEIKDKKLLKELNRKIAISLGINTAD